MNNVYPIRSYHHIGDRVQVESSAFSAFPLAPFEGIVAARVASGNRYYYRVVFSSGASLRLSQDDIVNNLTRNVV